MTPAGRGHQVIELSGTPSSRSHCRASTQRSRWTLHIIGGRRADGRRSCVGEKLAVEPADQGALGSALTDQKRETREVLSVRHAPVQLTPNAMTTSVARSTGPRPGADQRSRWSAHVWSPPPESNRRPHPYHGTTGNRCADGRSRRSPPTVGAEVIGSLSSKLCVLWTSHHSREIAHVGTAPVRIYPRPCHLGTPHKPDPHPLTFLLSHGRVSDSVEREDGRGPSPSGRHTTLGAAANRSPKPPSLPRSRGRPALPLLYGTGVSRLTYWLASFCANACPNTAATSLPTAARPM
jgi:hypothetical protein